MGPTSDFKWAVSWAAMSCQLILSVHVIDYSKDVIAMTDPTTLSYKNLKKDAIKAVYDTAEDETDEIGANMVGEAAKPIALTLGLGYGGDLWDSPVADSLAESMQGVIQAIIDDFVRLKEDIHEDWQGEPNIAEYYDSRSNWNGQARIPYEDEGVEV